MYQQCVSSIACMHIIHDVSLSSSPLASCKLVYSKTQLLVLFPRCSPCLLHRACMIRHAHALLAEFMQRLTIVPRSLLSLLMSHRLAWSCPVFFLRSIAPRITERTRWSYGCCAPKGRPPLVLRLYGQALFSGYSSHCPL